MITFCYESVSPFLAVFPIDHDQVEKERKLLSTRKLNTDAHAVLRAWSGSVARAIREKHNDHNLVGVTTLPFLPYTFLKKDLCPVEWDRGDLLKEICVETGLSEVAVSRILAQLNYMLLYPPYKALSAFGWVLPTPSGWLAICWEEYFIPKFIESDAEEQR